MGGEEERELQYLLEDPAGVHAPGEGLDGDHSLSHPQVGLSISHHAVLLLTDHCSAGQTQLLRIPERRRERTSLITDISLIQEMRARERVRDGERGRET